jgi:hypothetical protein
LGSSGGGGEPPGNGLGREPTPWERRRELGTFKGFFETLKASLFTPDEFFSRVDPKGPPVDALLYAWVTFVIQTVLALPLATLLPRKMIDLPENIPPQFRGLLEQMLSGGGQVVNAVGSILLYPVFIFIGAVILHGACLVFGAGKQGFWATFRVATYSTGPGVLAWIPCVNVAAMAWQIGLAVIGVRRVQQTSLERAMGSVALPIVVFICCCCLGVVLMTMTFASAMANMGPQGGLGQ